jgi:hypothetical protein
VTSPGPIAEDPSGSLLPTLLSSTDYTNYTSGNLTWYMNKVGSVIRDVCRWHLYPNLTVTSQLLNVEADGTIMLPSLYVTNVASVTALQWVAGVQTQVPLTTAQYFWQAPGSGSGFTINNTYIKILQPIALTETPQVLIDWQPPAVVQALVTYTHGYSALPEPVNVVGMELLTRALDERSLPSNYTALSAGPFHASIAEPGLLLTEQQLRMLGPYTLHEF